MNIGAASERSGVSAKMIRYYEEIGLLAPAARRDNSYRDYAETDIVLLQFIRRTRDLGFSLEEVGSLLALWRDRKRSSREVKRLAQAHIEDLEQRIKDMRTVVRTLRELTQNCHGDERSDCPILEGLAAPRKTTPRTRPSRTRSALYGAEHSERDRS
ncbi:MAG: Cu(I)-responsive transcriptional regulator [Alphaproteobacteria bacterium]|nr:Cu(I)-responsive transcriptional regulator [Alphaproteobacteria bacterium]